MRYFLLIFVVCVAAVIGIAGKRGSMSRKTPLYIFPDMKRQLKLRPQTPNDFFANGTSSQLAPAGTIGRRPPIVIGNETNYPYADVPAFIAIHLAGALIALAAGQMLFSTRSALSLKPDPESMNLEVRS